MTAENELVEPLCGWFREELGSHNLLLIHEEPQGRGGRRPDLLVVVGRVDSTIDDVIMIPVEIENSTRGAIHDPKNGLRQLRKYSGNFKYLAIPGTVARRATAREIHARCISWGAGLLVVNHLLGEVELAVPPHEQVPDRTLRTFPVAMRRWIALRSSTDAYRHISHGRIVDRV